MTHVWLRAEQRDNERRVCLTHQGAKALIDAGIQLSIEESDSRILDLAGYESAGAEIVAQNSWPTAPDNAIILGLKELPQNDEPLPHKHIMFGHAYKGQNSGKALLKRFNSGGGVLYDLEYLLDDNNRRVVAFGYWAGFIGAAISLKVWIAQQAQDTCPPVASYANKAMLVDELTAELAQISNALPTVIIIGALGRVGTGAVDLCQSLGIPVTAWDIEETQHGGPYPEVLEHNILLNCIVAEKGVPPFFPSSAITSSRQLTVVGDIACDPDSDYNPIPIYNQPTTWSRPAVRIHDEPVLDVMAIDNLPSLLPFESSIDFSNQLLPHLLSLKALNAGVWAKAESIFHQKSQAY